MVCPNCGNNFTVLGKCCPYCKQDLTIQNVNQHNKGKITLKGDSANNLYLVLGTIIPLFGLIYYLKNCNNYPNKSYYAIKGFKYNCIFLVLLIIILLFKIR